MKTFTGQHINFQDASSNTFLIEDIAASLSKQCRYNGHSIKFYSVAEHSVHVSHLVEHATRSKHEALHALLHDASEAYLGDITSPLKKILPDYKALEREFEIAIGKSFKTGTEITTLISEYDQHLAEKEMNELMNTVYFVENLTNRIITIHCWEPEYAELQFLKRFYKLSIQK